MIASATRIVPLALIAMACSHADPGISREKAEAALQAYDYVDISLQATPTGWSGGPSQRAAVTGWMSPSIGTE